MEKISSGFPSDVPRLLSLNSVIDGGSWKQRTEAAAEQHWVMSVFWLIGRWGEHQNMSWVSGWYN